MSDIIPEGILYGNLGVGSGTTNYNDLDNKPQINSVTLQGNKTASELGLVGTSDIPVTSVNGETGAVVLDGTEIEFSTGVSLNEKIIAVEQEIPVIAYPVTSVNGETGAVVLDGTEINYQAGKTINQKIDEVEAEIPVISYPVTSVNGETGAVVLDGTDIEYSSGVSVNSQIDTLMNYIPVYGNTASGAIATFDTSLALPLQDCTIEINAIQEGTGDPSPSNVRNIVGFTGAKIVNVSDYSTYFKGIYEGSYGFIDLGNVTWSKDTTTRPVDGATVHAFYTVISGVKHVGNTEIGNLILNGFATDTVRNVDYGGYDVVKDKIVGGGDNNSRVWVYDSVYNDYNTTEFRTAMSGKYLIYELATPTTPTITTAQFNTLCNSFDVSGSVIPITWQSEAGTVSEGTLDVTTGKLTVVNGSMGAGEYQITPIPINQISGTNNIFCDTGNTSVVYACSLKDYIDSQ